MSKQAFGLDIEIGGDSRFAVFNDGYVPLGLRLKVIERDGYICQLCGAPVTPDDVHIDHVIPVVRGGADVLENLQVAQLVEVPS